MKILNKFMCLISCNYKYYYLKNCIEIRCTRCNERFAVINNDDCEIFNIPLHKDNIFYLTRSHSMDTIEASSNDVGLLTHDNERV